MAWLLRRDLPVDLRSGRLDNLDRLALQTDDERRFAVPGLWNGVTPEATPLVIGDAPPDRFEVGIPGPVIGRIELDAMAIRVTKVEIERIADAMAARATLDCPVPA